MTASEFEQAYAERSGVPVELLRQFRTVRPCDCGESGCEGWQSISYERADEYDEDRRANSRPASSKHDRT